MRQHKRFFPLLAMVVLALLAVALTSMELRHCVLLEPRKEALNGSRQLTAQFVFMAYHSDALWRAGWLVHESAEPYATPAAENRLERVGCDFQVAPST